MNHNAMAWGALLTHLPRTATLCRGVLGTRIMTTGSGPMDGGIFDDFLGDCGIDVEPVWELGPNVLVIGHSDWDKQELELAIRAHTGGTLRVFSQEMVLASLALGADVFDVMSTDELAAFAQGHPALGYLSQGMGFDWPTTEVAFSSSMLVVDLTAGEWPETGVLKHMGYTVGRNGLTTSARREILRKVLAVTLVPGSDGASGYIEQWGSANSARRLQKMANCIAAFAQSKKRVRNYDYRAAIADWESDLNWLRESYYRPDLRFRWPDTEVP